MLKIPIIRLELRKEINKKRRFKLDIVILNILFYYIVS